MKQLWRQLQLGRESAEKLVTAENADVAVNRRQALSRKKARWKEAGERLSPLPESE